MTTPEVRSTNGSSPTNNATVERIMEMVVHYAVSQGPHARRHYENLRTQIAAMVEAQESIVNGLHVPTLKEVARRLLLDATFAHPQGGNEQGLGRALRMVEGMIERRSALTANQTTTPEDGK